MKLNLKKGPALWNKSKKIIPGGGQLLSKRAEMFLPGFWPAYFTKAKGVNVTDLDGNIYIDMSSMGIGACVLGYADPDVNAAVKKAIDAGSASTLNCPEEVELAEVLLKLHPWADMVRYARAGGEAMAIAARIARAYSGKEKIAFCGYHGWQDWYIASNLAHKKNLDGHLLSGLEPKGVPRGLRGTMLPFQYNHIEELEKIAAKHELAAIVIEPIRHQPPEHKFLERVKAIARKKKAVLVFDEISSAWRQSVGGAHLLLGVQPDMAVFAKAMGNGFPIAAILGKRAVMEAAQSTFISSTNWTERVGPVAALASIQKIQQKKVPQHLATIGRLIGDGWSAIAKKYDLNIEILGPEAVITFVWKYPNALELKTLFTQEMLERGFIVGQTVYVSYAHKKEHVQKYLAQIDEVFKLISEAQKNGMVRKLLRGPVAHSGFQRLT